MTTILSEGVYVPDVGDVNWAGKLEVNWNLLNGALANLSYNVKLDRDNIWTGEQSFTLPIVGSITGTASKAIADEDGTSIKTGYGKLAGNQTWTGTNTYTGAIAIRFNNTSYVSGTPSGNIFYSTVQWGGYVNNTWNAPFTINNAVRTNGYSDTSFRTYSQTSNTLTGFVHETNANASDISFRPIVNGTHKLGSSSYQWSSVYAQTYYYNGTQWGLDRNNTWTNVNTFNASANTVVNLQRGGSSNYSDIRFNDETSHVLSCIRALADLTIGCQRSSNWTDGSQIILKNNGSLQFVLNDGTNTTNIIANATEIKPTNAVTDLGTSTNKWKTLNGINPGGLSLPDASNAVALDTTNVSMDGTYTYLSVSINGWLYIILKDTSIKTDGELTFYIGDSGTSSAYAKWAVNFICSTDGYVRCFIPVLANSRIRVRVNPNGGSPTGLTLTLYPCLGNV